MNQKPHYLKHTRKLYSEEEWQGAMTMYAAGASAAAVSACYGMSASAIATRASALGITRRNSGEKPWPRARILKNIHRPREVYELAAAEYIAGETGPVVCERHKINKSTFHCWMCANGISKAKAARAAPPDPNPVTDDQKNAAATAAWRACAHPAQQAPEGDWRTWLFQGGRGAGKTRAGAEWLAARAGASKDGVFALVGATMRDVREVMVDGVSGLAHLPYRERPRFEVGRQRLLFPNGAVAYAFSAQEPERLRGPQFEAAWADELCAWKKPDYVLKVLRMGLRRGTDPRLVITTTPKPSAAFRGLRAEASCVLTQAGTDANAAHLAASFIEDVRALYGGTRFAAQELDGMLVEAGEAALWTAAMLAQVRAAAPPAFDEVVVGVDPPAGSRGSACGIIVAGRRGERAFVLADRSAQGLSPLGWASRVADAAREFHARTVVAEANQGGDMVRATLAGAGVGCAIQLVHATRNKRTRAEPVAALYERGLVAHCAAFPALEEEMMAIGDAESELKLDRADALVWAVTALLLERPGAGPRISAL